MRDYVSKIDNTAPSPSGILGADEDNVRFEELKQAPLTAGITLDPVGGPNTFTKMLSEAMARYASGGVFGVDSGAVNAYVVNTPLSFIMPRALFLGMGVSFYAGTTNTGASTLNVNGLGAKPFYNSGGTAMSSGTVVNGHLVYATYDPSLNSGGGAWKIAPWAAASGLGAGLTQSLVNVQVITASGTYTKTAGTNKVLVFATAGGGAGGSSDFTSYTGGTVYAGGGGESGATAISFVDVSGLSSIAVTIGAGGLPAAGSAASFTQAGSGGLTSFGSYASAPGGKGGYNSATTYFAAGGTTGGTGTVIIAGCPGMPGFCAFDYNGGIGGGQINVQGGSGGSSFWGGGGIGGYNDTGNTGFAGAAATGYGSGGGGGKWDSTTPRQGGAGKQGVIMVLEFA